MKYQENFPWDVNIADYAGHMAGKVRNLEDRRAVIARRPDYPDNPQVHAVTKGNDLAALDQELGKVRIHAHAAAAGLVYHDPADLALGCDAKHQRWVAEAHKRGALVNPSNYEPSLHADKGNNITVDRGSGAVQFGAPGSR